MSAALDTLHDLHTLTDADPRDLTHQQTAEIREYLHTDPDWGFYTFATLFFGFAEPGNLRLNPDLHGPMCRLLQHWGERARRIMVQVPRSAFKTTLLSRAGSLYLLCRDPNETVVIINKREQNVQKWLRAIRNLVESNLLFQELYREMLPPGVAKGDQRSLPKQWKWNDTEMLFERGAIGTPEVSLTAMGVGSAATGGHWTRVIYDDLINEEEQRSPVQMQSVRDWFDASIYLGMTPETLNAFICCTRWHFDDVYEYALNAHGFKLYRRSALENGETIWPERWTTEHLLHEREVRPVWFSSQMQNTPMAGEDTAFQAEWLRDAALQADDFGTPTVEIAKHSYDPGISLVHGERPPQRVPVHQLQKVLLLDPAPSKQNERQRDPKARNALVVKGIDAWGRRYWLDVWAGREGPVERARRIIRMLQRWGTNRLGVEEVVFSAEIQPWISYLAEREFNGFHVSYIPLKPGNRDKDYRIQGKRGSFQAGWEYVLGPVKTTLEDEYLTYPFGTTRDILDAGAYDEDPGVLPRPETELELEESEEEQFRWEESGDAITGY